LIARSLQDIAVVLSVEDEEQMPQNGPGIVHGLLRP
jgi:hypothetical protein